jgi:hypothetical protein
MMTTKMVCPKFFSNSCPTPGYIRGPAPSIVAAQHDSHTTSLPRILPAHPKKTLTAIQNIQLFSLLGENDIRKLCPRPVRLTVSARMQLRLLELCEFCCAGAAYLSGVGLRCRRHGRLCFGAEGLQEPEVPRT